MKLLLLVLAATVALAQDTLPNPRCRSNGDFGGETDDPPECRMPAKVGPSWPVATDQAGLPISSSAIGMGTIARIAPPPHIEVGQRREDVEKALGQPDGYKTQNGGVTEDWILSPQDTLLVTFKHDLVVSTRHAFRASGAPDSTSTTARHKRAERPSESGETTAERVARVAQGLYLSQACPAIYRKPLFFMTATDGQLLQTCNANGFMLFGIYLYNGGSR